ncbi:STAS domain-containing protein [Dactylosporangium sp. CS-047395]|uniref:STAS domain-containing protein n=1 Tax=Dactylosporangium sp. CS-047395 TaxID=3239936 RepID=UPI003D936D27
MPLTVTIGAATADRRQVILAGYVDESTASVLLAALDQAVLGPSGAGSPAVLEVDMAQVTHFSLAGLRVLDDVQHRSGCSVVLLGADRQVRRLLEVLHLQERFGLPSAHPSR